MKWPKIMVLYSTNAVNTLKKLMELLRIRRSATHYAIGPPIELEKVSEPDFEEQLKIAEEVMHESRDLLHKLGE